MHPVLHGRIYRPHGIPMLACIIFLLSFIYKCLIYVPVVILACFRFRVTLLIYINLHISPRQGAYIGHIFTSCQPIYLPCLVFVNYTSQSPHTIQPQPIVFELLTSPSHKSIMYPTSQFLSSQFLAGGEYHQCEEDASMSPSFPSQWTL